MIVPPVPLCVSSAGQERKMWSTS